MRYLMLGEVVALHQRVLAQSGGATGVRDLGLLESALAQPKATFESLMLDVAAGQRHRIHPYGFRRCGTFGRRLAPAGATFASRPYPARVARRACNARH